MRLRVVIPLAVLALAAVLTFGTSVAGVLGRKGVEAGAIRIPDRGVVVTIPDCAEDEPYLRGVGDFDGHRWDAYVCVHIDAVTVTP